MKDALKHVFAAILAVFMLFSCDGTDKATETALTEGDTVSIIFRINVEPYENGNVGDYTIQYKAIPLFGGQDTPGRKVNWTATEHDYGKFALQGMQKGEWTFYVRVVQDSSGEVLMETQTGTKQVTKDLVIILDETPELTGYGYVGIYARAEFIDDNQSIKVTYENTATGASYELINAEWKIVKTRQSYIDYSVNTEFIPAGYYIFTVEIYDHLGSKAMSISEPVTVRSTGTDPLIVKLRAESYPGGGIEIDDRSQYLEGLVTGPSEGETGTVYRFTYYPLNDYTEENAVWYRFMADTVSYSSREPYLEVSFPEGGSYLISCSPIGINGEVHRNGAATCRIKIAPPPVENINPDPETPEGGDGQEI